MFSGLDKAASMAQMMSIFDHQKQVSARLNGCTNYCIVGATGGLSVALSPLSPCNVPLRFLRVASACNESGGMPDSVPCIAAATAHLRQLLPNTCR